MSSHAESRMAYASIPLGVLTFLAFLSLITGSAIALEIPAFLFLLVGAVGGLAFLLVPLEWILWMLLLLGFVVIGPTVFFVKSLAQIQWIPPLAAGLLFLRALIERYRNVGPFSVAGTSTVSSLLSIFFVVAFLGAAYNTSPVMQLVVAYKNYLAVWGVFLILGWAVRSEDTIRALWRALLAIALLQFPFAVYQHFFVATSRSVTGRGALGGVAIWDSVVGTFEGSADGGGQSGLLAVFLVAMMAMALALWQERSWKGRWTLGFIFLGFATLLLGEVKIVIAILPLGFLVVSWGAVTRSLARLIGVVIFGILVLGTTLVTYDSLYWSVGRAADKDIVSNVEDQFGYVFDTSSKGVDYVTGSVSRAKAVLIWAEGKHDPAQWVIGHGPGASRSRSSIAVGEVARGYFPLQIDAVGLSVLLWDVGVAGTLAWCLLTAFGMVRALHLASRSDLSPFDRASLKTSAVVLSFTLVTLVYNKSGVDVFPMEFLQMLALGTVVFWTRRAK